MRAEHDALESLGPPALHIEGLQLWVHGRQFPESLDQWDGNWLRVTAHCGGSGASVWVEGAILMTSDLVQWADQCEALRLGSAAEATLSPPEPNLRVNLRRADDLGHLRLTVSITPDQMSQRHEFQFELDQSYLPGLTAQCRAITLKHPVRS